MVQHILTKPAHSTNSGIESENIWSSVFQNRRNHSSDFNSSEYDSCLLLHAADFQSGPNSEYGADQDHQQERAREVKANIS